MTGYILIMLGHPAEFPINRRHQGLATGSASLGSVALYRSFQSIGVTKDWRRLLAAGAFIWFLR